MRTKLPLLHFNNKFVLFFQRVNTNITIKIKHQSQQRALLLCMYMSLVDVMVLWIYQ